MFSEKPSQSASQGEPRHAGGRHISSCSRKIEKLQVVAKFTPCNTRFHPDRALCRINSYCLHAREIDNNSAITNCSSCHIMTSTANRYEQVVLSGEVDTGNDVRYAGTLNDHSRPFIDHSVVYLTSLIINSVFGRNQF